MTKIFLRIIKLYKIFTNKYLIHKCRFYPSCSSFFLLSLKKFSFFKAIFLFLKRILKCNCFFSGGYDPVP